jgi:hypothetical protein
MSNKTLITIICIAAIIFILALIWVFTKSSVKESISAAPFQAAFIEMAAAQNDPISKYLYTERFIPFDSPQSCLQKCDNEVDTSFGLTDTYGDERKQLCYAQCHNDSY